MPMGKFDQPLFGVGGSLTGLRGIYQLHVRRLKAGHTGDEASHLHK